MQNSGCTFGQLHCVVPSLIVDVSLIFKVQKKLSIGHYREQQRQNILLKILNRERSGYFNYEKLKSHIKIPYKEIPTSLAFCLKDIVPVCYLENHIFMGLTACGQFLIKTLIWVKIISYLNCMIESYTQHLQCHLV